MIDPQAPGSDTWGSLQRRVLEVLEDGRAHAVPEIAGQIGEPVSDAYRCLRRLRRQGVIDYADFQAWQEWQDYEDGPMPPERASFKMDKEWRKKWRNMDLG